MDEAIRAALIRAFLAGFMASGEGWNGEYPLERGDQSDLAKVTQDAEWWTDQQLTGRG